MGKSRSMHSIINLLLQLPKNAFQQTGQTFITFTFLVSYDISFTFLGVDIMSL